MLYVHRHRVNILLMCKALKRDCY